MGNSCSDPQIPINVYLLSQGQSEYDKLQEELRRSEQYNPEELKNIQFDEKLFDCELSDQGKAQCLKIRDQIQNQDVPYVFVSPLRRALQSAEIIFSQHKSDPKIIVLPLLRDILQSSSDINSRIFEAFRDYEYMDLTQVKQCGNVLNSYLQELHDQDAVQQIIEKVENKYGKNIGDQSVYATEINSFIKDISPDLLEKFNDIQDRIKNTKHYIRDFISKTKTFGDIFIVGHTRFFEYFTTKVYIDQEPKDYFSLGYCEKINWDYKLI